MMLCKARDDGCLSIMSAIARLHRHLSILDNVVVPLCVVDLCVVIASYIHVVFQVVVEDVRESRSLVCDAPVVRVKLALFLDVAIEVAHDKGEMVLISRCRTIDGPKDTMSII